MDYDARKQSLLSEQESQKVEFYFSCKHINASTAYLIIYLQQTNKPRTHIMQTKVAHGYDQTFDFADSLVLDYFFQVRQKLIIEVFSGDQAHHQKIGIVDGTVGQIFNGRNKGILKDIQNNGAKVGKIHMRCEKVQRGSSKYVQFNISCRNIDVGSWFLCFGEGGCCFRMYKVKNNEEYLVHSSEAKQGKNCSFAPIKINEKRLCNNDPKQPIIVRVFDSNETTVIGEVRTNLETLAQGKLHHTLMKGQREKGILNFDKFKRSIKYDFTDFLQNGMQMAMVVCIDFTASNGIQTQPSSLHYTTATKKSQYEQALHQVCSIVLDYDTDKLVPCFGFGAKVNMPNFNTYNKVHHCFPINGLQANPNLFQLAGIMQGYRKCLPSLSFSGPTYFAPLLREAMTVCESMKKQLKEYMILLILTDGIIHDKEEVKDLLVKCGKLPLSIIIIGIGNYGQQNWAAMHELDDDDCLMTDFQGNKTQRDLVQFVVFSEHNNNGVELAKEVLYELPRQVEEYHMLVNLVPQDYTKNLASDVVFQQHKI